MADRENHELQVRYAEAVEKIYEATIVTQDGVVFNNDYEGQPTAGAVKVAKLDQVTVKAYDRAKGLTPEEAKHTYEAMLIDQDDAVSVIIDGYEATAVSYQEQAKRVDQASKAMAQNIDTKALAILAKQGTAMRDTTPMQPDTVYNYMVDMAKALDEANVPDDGRYVIVSPETYALLLKSPEFVRIGTTVADQTVKNGNVGYVANMLVKKSSKLGKTGTENVEAIAGHPSCATRAREWAVPVSLHNAGTPYIGSSVVDGRNVFGHKVTYKAGIVVKKNA